MLNRTTDDDRKLFALARSARARVTGRQGAAVMDETGRSYAASDVVLPHLELTALQLAVAQAAAAGARSITSAVVVGRNITVSKDERCLVSDLIDEGKGSTILRFQPDGDLIDRITLP